MKALVYVQHLLGTGHTVRAAAIARELTRWGHRTTLVAGNTIPATVDTSGLTVETLPPARTRDATFSVLLDDNGAAVDEAWRQRRAERLLDIFRACEPDILVTETFPLGRRQFAFEVLPMLEAAGARRRSPLVACSVRDILVRKADELKERWMAEVANAHYDLVLVHADPAFVRLEDSFPFADLIAGLVRYTGYVHEHRAATAPAGDGDDEVIVSSGGGPVGSALLAAAVGARARSSRARDARWRILVGSGHDAARLAALRAAAGDGIVVERARPDFQDLLSRARLSVSQAGYNTVLDVLAAQCPAVLVPFEDENESEQLVRARLLSDRGVCQVVRENTLSARRLARAADDALGRPRQHLSVRLDGATAAADILTQEAERRLGR